MTQRAGRVICPRCGANNFDTVANCWKCGAPLGAAAPQNASAPNHPNNLNGPSSLPMPGAVSRNAPTSGGMMAGGAMPDGAMPVGMPGGAMERDRSGNAAPPYANYAPAVYAPPPVTGDSGAAKRAAIALALTIPWIGLPVGWVFMMIEDSRRQAIGRVCVNWSLIALVFHLLLMFVAAQAAGGLLQTLLKPAMDAAMQSGSRAGAGSGGASVPGEAP